MSPGAASTAVQRSFLRTLVPLRYAGTGVPVAVLREAFVRHELLIPRLLGTLEAAPLPALPRMMFAEAFQMMLSGHHQQRDVRAMFEDSGLEVRRWLNDDNSEAAMNSILRLLGYELLAASSFYEAILSITTTPLLAASIAARSVVSSDLKSDRIVTASIVAFDNLERTIPSGEREPEEALDVLAQEYFLLERDTFGKHRFDFRGANRYIMHCLEIENVTKTDRHFAFLQDPIVKSHGNFMTSSKEVHQGRWMEHRLWCGPEDTRVDTSLPKEDFVVLKGDGWSANTRIQFDSPICERMMSTHSSAKVLNEMTDELHVEVFELAVPDRDSTFLERWFNR